MYKEIINLASGGSEAAEMAKEKSLRSVITLYGLTLICETARKPSAEVVESRGDPIKSSIRGSTELMGQSVCAY